MHPAKLVLGGLSFVLVATLAAGCGSGNRKPKAGVGTASSVVQVSISHCGDNWKPGPAGHQPLVLHNADSRPGEVLLTDAGTGAVFGYLEPFAAGSTADLDVSLPAGRYRFRCAMEDEDVVDGPVVAVTGSTAAGSTTPGVLPVTQGELIGPTKQYQHYVTAQLPALDRQAGTLDADLRAGNLAAARRDWLPAHLQYERLGAAYGAFGDADGQINGTSAGLARAEHDPGFTGFHRLEYGLWHGQSAAALVPVAKALQASIHSLARTFTQAQLDPGEVAIRAHEITENAIQFELTGTTDYGSHTNLATVAANLAGTRIVLDLLAPLLLSRYPALGRTYASLSRAQRAVPVGQTLSQLSRGRREQLNADLGELVELLAPIAEICEPRRVS